jgi:cysteinyl-tRNA synthetase
VIDVQSGLVRIYRTLQRAEGLIGEYQNGKEISSNGSLIESGGEPFIEQFIRNMDDDLNTAGAIGLVFEKVKEMNRFMDDLGPEPTNKDLEPLKHDRHLLFMAARVLGVLNEVPEDFFETLSRPAEPLEDQDIEKMIEERNAARAEKKWNDADTIRDRLKDMGVILEDGPDGTTWRFDV